jgi:hypothetical protein
MPGLLADTITDTSGHQSRHIAVHVTGREVVVAVLFIVFVIVLLTLPVIWGAVSEAASSAAEKAAPTTFFLGLGVLCTGLVVGAELIAIAGASLVGLVVLGFIVDNYLGPGHRASCARSGGGATFLAGYRVEPGEAAELREVRVGRHHSETVLAGQRRQMRVRDQVPGWPASTVSLWCRPTLTSRSSAASPGSTR